MADIFSQAVGGQMAVLKQEIAELRSRLAEVQDEEAKKSIRRLIMDKETNYNILADRQKIRY